MLKLSIALPPIHAKLVALVGDYSHSPQLIAQCFFPLQFWLAAVLLLWCLLSLATVAALFSAFRRVPGFT